MDVRISDALIIVDVQRDFCPGGALPAEEGDAIVPIINRISPLFAHTFLTHDWHPPDHCSFSDRPEFVDKSWPVHCVVGSPGAEFHPDLQIPEETVPINKGEDPVREAYSAFEGTNLADRLKERGIRRVFVCELATDYCVKRTALDAAAKDLKTIVIEDACRGVDIPPGSVNDAINEMKGSAIALRESEELE